MPDCYSACIVKLFADDAKAYKDIASQYDRQVLKNRCVIYAYAWAERWELDLSYDKCCYLQIGYEDNSLSNRLRQHVLKPCNDARDLDITVHSNLSSGLHCMQIASKANARSKLILKSFYDFYPETLTLAFTFDRYSNIAFLFGARITNVILKLSRIRNAHLRVNSSA